MHMHMMIRQITSSMTEVSDLLAAQTNQPLNNDETSGLIDALAVLKTRFSEMIEAVTLAEIEAVDHLGELVIGDNRYYVGSTKRTKQIASTVEVIDALFASDDERPLDAFLTSQPFRPAAIRDCLGQEIWDRMFSVSTVTDIKTGKRRRGVVRASERFPKNVTRR